MTVTAELRLGQFFLTGPQKTVPDPTLSDVIKNILIRSDPP